MKKIYLILAMAVLTLVQAHAAVAVNDVIGEFTGTLTIGEDSQAGTVTLLPGKTGVTLLLPDFSFLGLDLGDIVVVNARMSSSGNLTIRNYALYIPLLSTHAMVSSNNQTSKLEADKVALELTIVVNTVPEPIPVTFNGTRASATGIQMPNSSFETNWHSVDKGVEPDSWHSFNSGTGSLINAAKNSTQLTEGTARPGSAGSKSAVIKARSVLGVVANGNLTNGQINAGSMTANNGAQNYNFSDPNNSGYNTPFTALPDSFVFWTKYNGNSQARMHTVITTNARYQDPESSNYSSIKVAEAELNYAYTNGWKRQSVPFVYSSVDPASAAYIMTTFTTNKTPGQGSASDEVMLDDIELIYNRHLTALTVDNEAISFTNGVGSTNKVYADSTHTIVASTNGKGAQAIIGYDNTNRCALIYVVGADYAGDKTAYEMYTVNFTGTATDLSDASAEAEPAKKVILSGQVLILRDGVYYDLLGNRVR